MTTAVFIFLVLVSSLVGCAVVAGSLCQHESDPAGNALTRAYTTITAIVLWALLLVVLLMSGAGMAAVLAPAAAVATQLSLSLMARLPRVRWPVVAIAGMPLLLLGYAVRSFFPPLQAAVHELAAVLISLGGTVGLSVIVFIASFAMRRDRSAQQKTPEQLAADAELRRQSESEQRRQSFAELSENSSLFEWWAYVEDPEYRDAALAGARRSSTREADAARMVAAGRRSVFLALPGLDVNVTPVLSDAVRTFFEDQVNHLRTYDPANPVPTKVVIDWFEAYLPTLQWIRAHGGDCRGCLSLIQSAIDRYPRSTESDEFSRKLGEIAASR